MRSNGEPYGVFPELFHLRPATANLPPEKYLSGVYFEFFEGDSLGRMVCCRNAIPLETRKRDCLAKLNAGKIREQGVKVSKKLRVLHEFSKTSPSYAAIRGMTIPPDDELCSLLASVALAELVDIAALP